MLHGSFQVSIGEKDETDKNRIPSLPTAGSLQDLKWILFLIILNMQRGCECDMQVFGVATATTDKGLVSSEPPLSPFLKSKR
jgi:hypothetical protein